MTNIFKDSDFDDDDKINYKQCVATDVTTLRCIHSTVDKFIQTATKMIYDLCHHHFIKDSQGSCTTRLKRKSWQQDLHYSDGFHKKL